MKYRVIIKYWEDEEECERVETELPFNNKEDAYKYIKNMYKNKYEEKVEVTARDGVKYTVIINKFSYPHFTENDIHSLWGKSDTSWYYVEESIT